MMQPVTDVRFDDKSFKRVKNGVRALVNAERMRRHNLAYASPIPVDIGIELTRRCNLRCAHCFLWSADGLYEKQEHGQPSRDLDFDILTKILRESEPARSNLFFWGTEPLLYRHWDDLASHLEHNPRWTVLCTNGTLVDKKMDTLLRISSHLATVISVDGFEDDHDRMRGKGCFRKVWNNIDLLMECQKRNAYHGTISIHCVLSASLIPHLYDFCCFVESAGVDSLYIGYPWYISAQMASRMDEFVAGKLSFLNLQQSTLRSWHAYSYGLGTECLSELKEQVGKISARRWKIRFRFQPAVEKDEIEGFVSGADKPIQNRKSCFAVSNRVDVRADGTVISCQCFPELVMGDLRRDDLLTIWHGDLFSRMRAIVSSELMPVCSRCILLYLNGK